MKSDRDSSEPDNGICDRRSAEALLGLYTSLLRTSTAVPLPTALYFSPTRLEKLAMRRALSEMLFE